MNTKVVKIDPLEVGFQKYNPKDSSLINNVKLLRKFGLPEDYIELHVYDLNDNLLSSDFNYSNYKSLLDSLPSPNNLLTDLNVDPANDAKKLGYDQGAVQVVYNILRKLFGSAPDNKFFIKTISSDRKELRIANNNISNADLITFYNNFLISFSSEAYYKDFYLNFGTGNLIIGVNVILEENATQNNLLIKLYEPLPVGIDLKDQFWIVDELSEPHAFQVDFSLINQEVQDFTYLRGPNLNIKINGGEVNSSTDYKNYSQLFSTTSTSSYQKLKSILEEKSLEINVDYEDYSNFIHFSSAKERLLNFVYKLKLIEGYQGDLATLQSANSTPQISSSKAIIENSINNVIEKFDGYEYFLYFESGSKAWPKSSVTEPWINYPSNNIEAISWLGSDNDQSSIYGGQLATASIYDSNNPDNLLFTIPEYLRVDPQNQGYESFLYMVGQHFDNIWLYSKAITDVQDANNNLNDGISKDLVPYALKSLGVKLYTNTNAGDNVFSYLLGGSDSGSLLASTGSEQITNYVTASNVSLPGSDIDKEVYKRIYHNLPYLLKTKGTERGLRALMACYGIPDTILSINEFGGTDKESGSVEQYFPHLSYALDGESGSVFVQTPWAPSVLKNMLTASSNIVPDVIEFRFKTKEILSENYSQSLFQVESGSNTQFGLQLLYVTESFSGSNKYGQLKFAISGSDGFKFSEPITLPFFNDNWWNVTLFRETGSRLYTNNTSSNTYKLWVGNSIYNGHDGDDLGFYSTSSLFISGGSALSSSYHQAWNQFNTSSLIAYLGGTGNNNSIHPGSSSFNGYLQELRYWINPLNYEDFYAHTINPSSYEFGDNPTGSYNNLIYRLPLGADLKISSSVTASSVHPNYRTGSFVFGGVSQTSSLGYINSPSEIIYESDDQFYYMNAGNFGSRKPTNNKIRIIDQDVVSGSTLSIYKKLQQDPEVSLTKDNNILEIAISPTDQVNNDIIDQLGYFDIDEYIGDPREATSREYPTLKQLREFYFQKYISRYNTLDLFRLIKYYNNSLFKMIKDFTPGRTNVTTGIVVKPNLLERSKYERHEPESFISNYTQSIEIGELTGDHGNVWQMPVSGFSFTQSYSGLSGSVNILNNKGWEAFTGELGGTEKDVLLNNGVLTPNNVWLNDSYRRSFIVTVSSSESYITQASGTWLNFSSSETKINNEIWRTSTSFPTFISQSDVLIYSGSIEFIPIDPSLAISGGATLDVYIQGDLDYETFLLYQETGPFTVSSSLIRTWSLPSSSVSGAGNNIFAEILGGFSDSGTDTAGTGSIILNSSILINCGSHEVISTRIVSSSYLIWSKEEEFTKSDFHTLLNNISTSRVSKNHFNVDYSSNPNIAVNLDLIQSASYLVYAPIQDSNYSLKGWVRPRYEGSKVTSAQINVWNVGDNSYGKTAAIDNQTRKIGLFTNISNSVFLNNKSEINLKYLVDEDGNLTELSGENNNWFEVQNLFKAGSNIFINQFDPLKYGNQRKLNGGKQVYTSGYSYTPQLYFSSSDTNLMFYPEDSNDPTFEMNMSTNPLVDLGSNQRALTNFHNSFTEMMSTVRGTTPTKSDDIRGVPFLNNVSLDTTNACTLGTLPVSMMTFSTSSATSSLSMSYFTIPIDGLYSFRLNINLNSYFYQSNFKSYIFNWTGSKGSIGGSSASIKYFSPVSTSDVNSHSFGLPSGSYISGSTSISSSILYGIENDYAFNFSTWSLVSSTSLSQSIHDSVKIFLRPTVYRINGAIKTNIEGLSRTDGVVSYWSSSTPYQQALIIFTASADNSTGTTFSTSLLSSQSLYRRGEKIVINMLSERAASSSVGIMRSSHFSSFDSVTNTLSSSITNNTLLSSGNIISSSILPLQQVGNARNYPVSILDDGSSLTLTSFIPIINVTASAGNFIVSMSSDTLFLTSSFTSIMQATSSFFSNSSSLFSQFGSVEDIFKPEVNDVLILGSTETRQYNIKNIYTSNGNLAIQVQSLFLSETPNSIRYFLLLKRSNDETNAIINFNKLPDPSSYGFVIPNNLHPDVMNNIDEITREVKAKLIELGVG